MSSQSIRLGVSAELPACIDRTDAIEYAMTISFLVEVRDLPSNIQDKILDRSLSFISIGMTRIES